MTVCESPVRKGIAAPPLLSGPLDVAAILADIERRELMPLSELGERLGFTEQARRRAVREGLIETAPVKAPDSRGQRRVKQVDRDEALNLVLAAALAFAAGVAIVIMLKAVKGSGMDAAAALGAIPT